MKTFLIFSFPFLKEDLCESLIRCISRVTKFFRNAGELGLSSDRDWRIRMSACWLTLSRHFFRITIKQCRCLRHICWQRKEKLIFKPAFDNLKSKSSDFNPKFWSSYATR